MFFGRPVNKNRHLLEGIGTKYDFGDNCIERLWAAMVKEIILGELSKVEQGSTLIRQ